MIYEYIFYLKKKCHSNKYLYMCRDPSIYFIYILYKMLLPKLHKCFHQKKKYINVEKQVVGGDGQY